MLFVPRLENEEEEDDGCNVFCTAEYATPSTTNRMSGLLNQVIPPTAIVYEAPVGSVVSERRDDCCVSRGVDVDDDDDETADDVRRRSDAVVTRKQGKRISENRS